MTPPTDSRSLPHHLWPVGLNTFLLFVLLGHCIGGGPDSFFILLFTLFATAANVLGVLVALLQRRWAVAAWYGLAFMLLLGAVFIALALVEVPWNKDE